MRTVRVFLSNRGPSSVWDALRSLGHPEAELVRCPEIVAWAAARNAIEDFRKIPEGTCVELPVPDDAQRVISKVRDKPRQYGAALESVRADMRLYQHGCAADRR